MNVKMKETKEIIGDIQAIKKDRKAVEIENIWYSSQFKIIPEDIEKFDTVKIVYSQNKSFNNIVSIEKQSLKPSVEESEQKVITPLQRFSDSTLNCLIMQSVQYSEDKKISLDQATSEILNAYNKIKQSI